MRGLIVVTIITSWGTGVLLAQDPTATNLFTVSPTISVATGTKSQQMYSGSTIVSHIASRAYCDVMTRQFGVLGGASDSITQSKVAPITPAVDVITNDFGGGYLQGFGARKDIGKDTNGAPLSDVKLTQNFVSGSADYYMNNSLGMGLQQSYTVGWERYLTACPDRYITEDKLKELKAKGKNPESPHLFVAFGLSAGYSDQRLYHTAAHVRSVILPASLQGSYVWQGDKQADGTKKPPKGILSAQISYTPLLNELHAYQVYETSSFTIPTGWTNVTVAFTQTDYYLNNAPSSYKRNYASEGIVLTWTIPAPKPPVNAAAAVGACYTVDKSSHLFCYDSISQNGCIPPSVFRSGASCGAVGSRLLYQTVSNEPTIQMPGLEEREAIRSGTDKNQQTQKNQ